MFHAIDRRINDRRIEESERSLNVLAPESDVG
jgi:hypothetical protein